MGIRFLCPNGHKMNVKSFLAGRKGICPKCGIRVDIPRQSTVGGDDGSDGEGIDLNAPQLSQPLAEQRNGITDDNSAFISGGRSDGRSGGGAWSADSQRH